jgi:hypothetical protein
MEVKTIFKFENMWLKLEGFVDKVKQCGYRITFRVLRVLFLLVN